MGGATDHGSGRSEDALFQPKRLLASSVAGICARLSTHPFDTVRTRIMVQLDQNSHYRRKHLPVLMAGVVKKEGFAGLYRGLGVAVSMGAPATAVYLTTYDLCKLRLVERFHWEEQSTQLFIASATGAEVASGALWTPMEVIKQRVQVQESGSLLPYRGPGAVAREIWRRDGPRGFFRGYFSALTVFLPHSVTFFVAYEMWKRQMGRWWSGAGEEEGQREEGEQWLGRQPRGDEARDVEELPAGMLVAGSFLSGCIGGLAANPFEVVKTTWQVQEPDASGRLKFSGPLHIARSILGSDGVAGFFKGVTARVMWVAPSAAISLSTYELLKRRLDL